MIQQHEKISENKTYLTAAYRSGAAAAVQLKNNREYSVVQRKFAEGNTTTQLATFMPVQRKMDHTGLPDILKSGIENLSGHSMDDVKVHYNSGKPAQLNAHAYAQGTDIHIASGQEKHLPHEAWHVVQQKQGRVKPTLQMKGKVNVNDDAGLEKEADVMGAKALQMKSEGNMRSIITQKKSNTAQRFAFMNNQNHHTIYSGTVQRTITDQSTGTTYNNVATFIAAMKTAGVWDNAFGKALGKKVTSLTDFPTPSLAALAASLKTVHQSTVNSLALGGGREDIVANFIKGRVAKVNGQDEQFDTGDGKTTPIDVCSTTVLAIVGGAAKANNLGHFKARVHELKKAADHAGLTPQVWQDSNTPESVIKAAGSIVGQHNVYDISTGKVFVISSKIPIGKLLLLSGAALVLAIALWMNNANGPKTK